MNITTKYDIGTHIWVIYEDRGVVCVYDEYIGEIAVSEKCVYYITKDSVDEIYEKDIVLYDDIKGLYDKIAQKMAEIREKEERG